MRKEKEERLKKKKPDMGIPWRAAPFPGTESTDNCFSWAYARSSRQWAKEMTSMIAIKGIRAAQSRSPIVRELDLCREKARN